MSLHLPANSLSKVLTLCAFSVCVATVLGADALLKPAMPPLPISAAERPRAIETLAELPIPQNTAEGSSFAAEIMAVSQQIGMTVTLPPASDPDSGNIEPRQQDATFVGVWAPDASSCSVQNFRDGLLPTVINLDGAVAGETFCGFKNPQQTQNGWRVDARCSSKQEQWSTRVHLIVSGDRLVWKSKRGSQAYTRCTNDMRIAMH